MIPFFTTSRYRLGGGLLGRRRGLWRNLGRSLGRCRRCRRRYRGPWLDLGRSGLRDRRPWNRLLRHGRPRLRLCWCGPRNWRPHGLLPRDRGPHLGCGGPRLGGLCHWPWLGDGRGRCHRRRHSRGGRGKLGPVRGRGGKGILVVCPGKLLLLLVHQLLPDGPRPVLARLIISGVYRGDLYLVEPVEEHEY